MTLIMLSSPFKINLKVQKTICVVGVFFLSLLPFEVFAKSFDADEKSNHIKLIQYEFEVINTTNRVLNDASLQFNLPRQDTSSLFAIKDIELSPKLNFEINSNKKEQSLIVLLPFISPYESKKLTAKLQIKPDISRQIDNGQKGSWLADGNLLKINHPQIQETIQKIGLAASDTPQKVIEKIYQWTIKNIKPTGFSSESLGALHALDHQQADCTDTVYLFTSLMRANGIPTRMLGGFIVETNKKLSVRDYHNWTEIFVNGAWQVVDPFLQKFNPDKSHYLALVELSPETNQNPKQQTALFRSSSPSLSIKMH